MLVTEINPQGLLSFGHDTPPLNMKPLNILIGPNGSGKSNLVEGIGLLRASAGNLQLPMRGAGGGVREWIWKGGSAQRSRIYADFHRPGEPASLRHLIQFEENHSRLELTAETIETSMATGHYRWEDGKAELSAADGTLRHFGPDEIDPNNSVLSQLKDPVRYPALAFLTDAYGRIRIYREWSFGRSSVFRVPQPSDLPSDRLEEDFSNFGLFLNHLRGVPRAKNAIIEHLRDLYAELEDFDVRIKGGTVEVFLTEHDFIVPASRLSDGTLRYLCLLAILCDPDPPPLICMEEPELGLHPDILPKIADLLVEASERTQLIVTTHSDILVDTMTDTPESVVVVEKHDRQTRMERLRNDGELKEMLQKYRLGELWMRGDIGGTRW
jgi:predicted ATPase